MNLSPEDKQVGKENFFAAIGSKQVKRTHGKGASRDFLLEQIKKGYSSRKGMGAYYFGYESKVKEPLRVGVIGTGDEGNVLLGAINPEFVAVKAIADIRPFGIYRALHGEAGVAVRPGLMSVYGWKTEAQALENLKIYRQGWQELLENAKADHLEAVIIALPLFLHAPVAIAAMKKGLHVLTEKLMGQTVVQCKEMARVAQETKLLLATGHQRHYSILYDNAVELVRNGVLGDLHYISAQWHRGNLPKKDSWKMPLPPGAKSDKDEPDVLEKELHDMIAQREKAAKDKKSTESRSAESPYPAQGKTDRGQDGRGREVRVPGKSLDLQGRFGQRGDVQPPRDRGAHPLAALGSDRRRHDGRTGQPPTRRGKHFHFGHARPG